MSSIRLFISHSERDEALVRPLYIWLQSGLGLEDREIRCTSIDNISAGDAAVDKLRDDMEAADAVVGLLTFYSLRSHWVSMEMGASWLKKRLFPVRGPGMRPKDLPSPLPIFTTVGYCEKAQMGRLLRQLAALMQRQINQQAEFDLANMISTAENYMSRQITGWFELPPILSAWRLRDTNFSAPLRASLARLNISEQDRPELEECAGPGGIIVRDPPSLPAWARDHWMLSKLTVNHLLTGTGRFDDLPHGILDEKLTAELRLAWAAKGRTRDAMLYDWMRDASAHIALNLPRDARGH